MSYITKDIIHTTLVNNIYNEILSRRGNYYYFIGRIIPWDGSDNPETPEQTYSYESTTRNKIVAVKKIQPTDVSYVVPRVNWTSGTVYDQYDGNYSSSYESSSGATSIKTASFYVLTSEFNVYKCLFNRNGIASTAEPTGTDPTPVSTADGYVWKFLYNLPLSLRNRFLTEEYMPVLKSVQNSFYSNGEVDRINIISRGSGYLGNAEVSLRVYGQFNGGSGNSIANLIPVFNDAGTIIDVIIKDAGNNYASANVAIVDNAGTGTGYYNALSVANIYPILYNTRVDRVLIDDPGIGYRSNIQTTLVLTGDGSGANLIPFVNESGELEDVVIVNRGSGYTYLDIEVVGDGSNANVTADLSTGDLDTIQSTVELAAIDGAIHALRVHNGGSGYSHANVAIYGDGAGFSGNVVLVNNAVSYISVTNPGSGYTYANVVITGDGSNANLTAIMSPVGGHGFNPVKELYTDTVMFYSTINNEKIHGIDVTNDYRQFGIIKDVKKYGVAQAYANVTGTPCFLVTTDTILNSLTETLAVDTILELETDSTRVFEVVQTTANNKVLVTSLNNYELEVEDVLYDANTSSRFVIQEVDHLPSINKFSGDILFVDNRTKVSYSDQQLVTLRTIVKL